MGLAVAAIAQLLIGVFLYRLGSWGRSSADDLAGPRFDEEEHRIRADGLVRGGLVCQGLGVLLTIFAFATAVAAIAGVEPTLRPQ